MTKNQKLINKFIAIFSILIGFNYVNEKASAEEINNNIFDFHYSDEYKFSFDTKINFNVSTTPDFFLSQNPENSQTEENLVGKLFNIGKQPVNTSLQGYWNAEKPKNGAEWTARFQFQLLFPIK